MHGPGNFMFVRIEIPTSISRRRGFILKVFV